MTDAELIEDGLSMERSFQTCIIEGSIFQDRDIDQRVSEILESRERVKQLEAML